MHTRIQAIARIECAKGADDVNFRAFAALVGSSDTVVRNYIQGTRTPPADFLVKLLDVFPGVSAEWLMRGTGCMFIEDEHTINQNNAQGGSSIINGSNTGSVSTNACNDALLREKDERIAELKERVSELKDTIQILKNNGL